MKTFGQAVLLSVILLTPANYGTGEAADPIFSIKTFSESGGQLAVCDGLPLAFDQQGNPRLCYPGNGRQLRYAERVGFEWRIETVVQGSSVGAYPYLAVDDQGIPHIAYRGGNSTHYAVRSGGTWITESVSWHSQSFGIGIAEGEPRILVGSSGAHQYELLERSSDGWRPVTGTDLSALSDWCSMDMRADGHYGIAGKLGDQLCYLSSNSSWECVLGETMSDAIPAVALDSNGNPWIVYFGPQGSDLRCASRIDGSWQVETVDSTGAPGLYEFDAAVAVGDHPPPHIGYYDETKGQVKWATRRGGQWVLTVVDSVGIVGQDVSVALGADGSPSFGYRDKVTKTWRFADGSIYLLSPQGGERWPAGSRQSVRWQGGGSVVVEVSADGGLTYSPLLTTEEQAVDVTVPDMTTDKAKVRIRRDFPQSQRETPGLIAVAPGLVSPWWMEPVETGGFAGNFPSLALDSLGRAHVSYFDIENSSLKYAEKNGDSWIEEIVDNDGSAGWDGSLALDSAEQPRISYRSFADKSLRFARRETTGWVIETVDESGDVGQFSSLRLDPGDRPLISYYDASQGDLKLAFRADSSWSIEAIDVDGNVGQYGSLVLDDAGNPHVSYYDVDGTTLKYATKVGGSWMVQVVDSSGSVGKYCSIDLDPSGSPMISYWDEGNGDLRIAIWNGAGWQSEIVDAAVEVDRLDTSLRIDSLGRPWISFHDGVREDLKIAVKNGGWWSVETIDSTGRTGLRPSLALDADGNPRIAYYDFSRAEPGYASAAIELTEPVQDIVWPVGAERTIRWEGTGRVAIWISYDDGGSYDLLADGMEGGEYHFSVPPRATQRARIKIHRQLPRSSDVSRGSIVIDPGIVLVGFHAAPVGGFRGGAALSWETSPGPEDLSGYRIERKNPGDMWETIVPFTSQTAIEDAGGVLGARYRLFGRNRLDEEQFVGETQFRPRHVLTAWPVPFRGEELSIGYLVAAGDLVRSGEATVSIHSASGRLVCTLRSWPVEEGFHVLTWDGHDTRGVQVPGGVYFLKSRVGGKAHTLKFVVAR